MINSHKQQKKEKKNMERHEKNQVTEMEVTELLIELGIPAHIRGYHYIRAAVMMVFQDGEEVIGGVTKFLYPMVAKKYNTNPQKVERAIRNAIETSFNRDPEKFRKFFRNTCWEKRPTNTEFIATFVEKIRMGY